MSRCRPRLPTGGSPHAQSRRPIGRCDACRCRRPRPGRAGQARFKPRFPPPFLSLFCGDAATNLYDTAPPRETGVGGAQIEGDRQGLHNDLRGQGRVRCATRPGERPLAAPPFGAIHAQPGPLAPDAGRLSASGYALVMICNRWTGCLAISFRNSAGLAVAHVPAGWRARRFRTPRSRVGNRQAASPRT